MKAKKERTIKKELDDDFKVFKPNCLIYSIQKLCIYQR